ncbi:MAG: radical SAM protein [Bacteroidota bacterium]|nr:radical SAM protein [Bacteroidota bacterium]
MEDYQCLNMVEPVYIQTAKRGILKERIVEAYALLESCCLCPRNCNVNRNKEQKGICKTGRKVKVSSFHPHFGEESPLVGIYGSGTIFFSNCNLLCNFCQNYDISHLGQGMEISNKQLAGFMLDLQERGCHNINLVTPSHVVPQILSALEIAISKGLNIPLVYNTGGYDSLETLKLLDGIIDIYMPDLKFMEPEDSILCGLPEDYPEITKRAIVEMHRQVGDLKVSTSGIATRGLLIRHLVMPGDLSKTEKTMRFIATEISENTYVNIMSQYRPAYIAVNIAELNRQITETEFKKALESKRQNGLLRAIL